MSRTSTPLGRPHIVTQHPAAPQERMALAIPRGIAEALLSTLAEPNRLSSERAEAALARPVGRLFGEQVVHAALKSTCPG